MTEGGETPFVIGAAQFAQACGTKVFFVYCNPDDVLATVPRSCALLDDPRIEKIRLVTGPMAISGSTRMQATTIQQLALVTIMEAAIANLDQDVALPDAGWVDAFEAAHTALADDETVESLARLVELEEAAYRRGRTADYVASSFALDVLTDTTERSPTFSVPPFRKAGDDEADDAWARVWTAADSAAAWHSVLGRPTRCLAWEKSDVAKVVQSKNDVATVADAVRRVGEDELLRFRIGADGPWRSRVRQGSFVLAIIGPDDADDATFCRHLECVLARARGEGATTAALVVGETDGPPERRRRRAPVCFAGDRARPDRTRGAEDGAERALHRRDGAHGAHRRQLHGVRRADEQQADRSGHPLRRTPRGSSTTPPRACRCSERSSTSSLHRAREGHSPRSCRSPSRRRAVRRSWRRPRSSRRDSAPDRLLPVRADVVIRGGLVADGSGAEARVADVAVAGAWISAVGQLADFEAASTIDASGCVVLPGFVDAHVHAEGVLLNGGSVDGALLQGITTFVLGQDGTSLAPATSADVLATLDQYWSALNGRAPTSLSIPLSVADLLVSLDGASVNVAYLVPNGNVRLAVAGWTADAADAEQLDEMRRLVRNGVADGAVGVSSGLDYTPSKYANVDELGSLCSELAAYGLPYVTHMRGYRQRAAAGIAEAVEIAKRAKTPLHVSHFSGTTDQVLPHLDRAEESGVDISFDAYPFVPSSTILAMAALPAELQVGSPDDTIDRLRSDAGREALRAHLASPDSRDVSAMILAFVDAPSLRHLEGMQLADAAEAEGMALSELIVEMLVQAGFGVAIIDQRIGAFSESDIREIARDRRHMVGSDGIYVGSHPHVRCVLVVREVPRRRGARARRDRLG